MKIAYLCRAPFADQRDLKMAQNHLTIRRMRDHLEMGPQTCLPGTTIPLSQNLYLIYRSKRIRMAVLNIPWDSSPALLHHQDPTTIVFLEPRSPLAQSLLPNTMAPFPTSTLIRTPIILHSITEDIFCSCREIDTRPV